MAGSAFIEKEFFELVLFSIFIPIGIYAYLMWIKSISRAAVFAFGVVLILISGTDIYLLQRLKTISEVSSYLYDDKLFASEVSIALYLLPALFAGIGINIISHILMRHLIGAERRFDLKIR